MLEGGLTKRLDELKESGFHIAARPSQAPPPIMRPRQHFAGLLAATRAPREVDTGLADAGVTEEEDELVSIKEFNSLVGLEHRLRIEEQLPGANKSPEEKLPVRIRGKTKPAN